MCIFLKSERFSAIIFQVLLVLHLLYFLLKLAFQGICSVSTPPTSLSWSFYIFSFLCCVLFNFLRTAFQFTISSAVYVICALSCPLGPYVQEQCFSLEELLHFFSDECTVFTFEGASSISSVDSVSLWFVFLGVWFSILFVSSSPVRLFFSVGLPWPLGCKSFPTAIISHLPLLDM